MYLLVVVVRLMLWMEVEETEKEATEWKEGRSRKEGGEEQREIVEENKKGIRSSGALKQLSSQTQMISERQNQQLQPQSQSKELSSAATAATTTAASSTTSTPFSAFVDKLFSAHTLFNLTITLVNIVVILSVNAAFVYSIGRNDLSHDALLLTSLAVSAFKLFWSNVVLADWCVKIAPAYFSELRRFVVSTCCSTSTSSTADSDTSNSINMHPVYLSPTIHVVLSLFNNVMAPYLTEAVVSPNCFHYAFWSAPPVASTSRGSTCYVTGYVELSAEDGRVIVQSGQVTCAPLSLLPSNVTVLESINRFTTLSFLPPFAYNHGCSSSLVTAFVYVFVWRFVLSGVVLPCVALVLKWVQWMLAESMYVRSFAEVSLASAATLYMSNTANNAANNNTNNADANSSTSSAAATNAATDAQKNSDINQRQQPSVQPMSITDETRRREVAHLRWWFRRVTQVLPIVLRLLDGSGPYSYGDTSTRNTDIINNNNNNKNNGDNIGTSNINTDEDRNSKNGSSDVKVSEHKDDVEEIKVNYTDQNINSSLNNSVQAPNQREHSHNQQHLQRQLCQPRFLQQQHKLDYIHTLNHTDILPALLFHPTILSANARGVTIVADLAVLLTFGVLFPPLAVIIFVAIVLEQAFHRLVWGRYAVLLCHLSNSEDSRSSDPCVDAHWQQSRFLSRSLHTHMSYRTASDGWNISTTIASPLMSIDVDATGTNEHAADTATITAMNTALNAATSVGALEEDECAQNVVQRHSNRVNYNNYNQHTHSNNNNAANNLQHNTYAPSYTTLLHHLAHSFDPLARLLIRGTSLAVIFCSAFWSLTLYDTLAGGSSNSSDSSGHEVSNRVDSRDNSASSDDSWWIVLAMALAPFVLFHPVRLSVLLGMQRQRRRQKESIGESAPGHHDDTDNSSCDPRRRLEDPEAALSTTKTSSTSNVKDPQKTYGGGFTTSYTTSPIILISQQPSYPDESGGERGSGIGASPPRHLSNSTSSSGSSYPRTAKSSYGASTSASSSFLRSFGHTISHNNNKNNNNNDNVHSTASSELLSASIELRSSDQYA